MFTKFDWIGNQFPVQTCYRSSLLNKSFSVEKSVSPPPPSSSLRGLSTEKQKRVDVISRTSHRVWIETMVERFWTYLIFKVFKVDWTTAKICQAKIWRLNNNNNNSLAIGVKNYHARSWDMAMQIVLNLLAPISSGKFFNSHWFVLTVDWLKLEFEDVQSRSSNK